MRSFGQTWATGNDPGAPGGKAILGRIGDKMMMTMRMTMSTMTTMMMMAMMIKMIVCATTWEPREARKYLDVQVMMNVLTILIMMMVLNLDADHDHDHDAEHES